jgi:hypothetical protein
LVGRSHAAWQRPTFGCGRYAKRSVDEFASALSRNDRSRRQQANTPFLFTEPGFEIEEIEPHDESGET